MRDHHHRRAWALLLTAIVSTAAVGCSPRPDAAASSHGPGVDGLIDWMAAHPDQVGLVVIMDGEQRLAHQPDEHFPLASTIKVLTLLAYGEQVAAGRLDEQATVPVDDIDRVYLPGTDGGAHEAARAEWDDAAEITLDSLTRAMIRYSSNAAADVMLQQVGGPAAALAVAQRHGMTGQEAPAVIHELFRSWQAAEDSVRDLAAASPGGTPREWASLMERIRSGQGLSPRAADIVRRHLEWPLALGDNRRDFEVFGTKGGSLPAIITEASYLTPRGASPVAVALFLRDLPEAVERDLRASFAHQLLLRDLAEQPDLLTELARRLSA